MFPDLEFIKTCLNGLRSQIERVEKQTKNWVTSFVRTNRPNWAQNDPNALDYVKGRTHWEKEAVVDMSGALYKITGFTDATLTVTYDVIPLELGQVWSVQGGNGSAYTNVEVQRNADGVLYLGTLNVQPFYITKDTATINYSWFNSLKVDSLTLTCTSGSATIRTVHSLNPKFLPSPTSNTVGAIKADAVKTTDIQPVRLGTDGKLYSSGVPIFTTSGTGSAYTANVPEITKLVNGMLVVMIPHVASGSTAPTLNINGLGAHQIRRFKSSGSSNNYSGSYSNWLYPGAPVLLMYNSGRWFACNFTRPDADDLLGPVSALHGGTGASSLKQGSYLVGNGIGKVLQKTPSEVLADIGAIPVPATASVGQTIVVKAVDDSGKPTAWSPADFPSGGGSSGFEVIGDLTTEEVVQTVEFPYTNQDCSEIIVLVVPSAAFKPSNTWFRLSEPYGRVFNFAHINTINMGTNGFFVAAKITKSKVFSTLNVMGDYMWNSTSQYSFHYNRERQTDFTKILLDFATDVPAGTVIKVFAR